MDREQLIQDLVHIVGAQYVTSDPNQIQACGFWESSRPEVIVFPGNKDEVQKIVAFTFDKRIPLVPVGGGSSIKRVLTPFQKGIGVVMSRLNQVEEFEPDNLSARVEAGVVNRDLQEILNAHNLLLPLLPDHIQSTIGGEVAADTGARKRCRYGSMSDYVLGVEFVSPQGRVVKTGGKTVKNVSGYDFTKLLAGSWGTMGVITAVTLKLKPMPEDELILLAGFDSMVDAVQAADRITAEKLEVAALDVLYDSRFRWEMFDVPVKAVLLAALEGSREVVVAHGKRIERLFLDRPVQKYGKNSGISAVWDNFHHFRRQIQSGCYGLVTFDKRDMGKIRESFPWFEEFDAVVQFDTGSGVLEFSLGDRGGELPKEFVQRWDRLGEKLGSRMKTSFGPQEKQPLLERVLTSVDPHNIMFPANAIIRGVNRG